MLIKYESKGKHFLSIHIHTDTGAIIACDLQSESLNVRFFRTKAESLANYVSSKGKTLLDNHRQLQHILTERDYLNRNILFGKVHSTNTTSGYIPVRFSF